MDAFFASVELIRAPDLRGRPVIVGGEHRGVVLAATYEARAFGVHSAMPMTRARALCPQAVVIPPDHARYEEVSRVVMGLLADVTPVLEQVSVDEAFLDVSGARRRLGSPVAIATAIRSRIREVAQIPASVGVASTKFLAKLASQTAKPDGLLLVPEAASVPFLHSLPVGALWGVGERTAAQLREWGIESVEQLAHTPPDVLQRRLGRAGGARLYDLAWNRDPRPVTVARVEKSISSEHTFVTDVTDAAELGRTLLEQAHRCARRLRRGGFLARGVTIKVRMSDFTTLTRSRQLDHPSDVAHDVYAAARALLAAVTIPRDGVRLLGVRVDQLTAAAATPVQLALDDDAAPRREVEVAMDDVRDRFGADALGAASLLATSAFPTAERDLS